MQLSWNRWAQGGVRGSPPGQTSTNSPGYSHHPAPTLARALQTRSSPVAQLVKNPPAMQETWVAKILWRREGLPTPVFWPGEFHGLYSPRGHKESEATEWLERGKGLICSGSSPVLPAGGATGKVEGGRLLPACCLRSGACFCAEKPELVYWIRNMQITTRWTGGRGGHKAPHPHGGGRELPP